LTNARNVGTDTMNINQRGPVKSKLAIVMHSKPNSYNCLNHDIVRLFYSAQ